MCAADDQPPAAVQGIRPGIARLLELSEDATFLQSRQVAMDSLARAEGQFSHIHTLKSEDGIARMACFDTLYFEVSYMEGGEFVDPVTVPGSVDGELLARTLVYLPDLTDVRLPMTNVSNDGLKHLRLLPELKWLSITSDNPEQYPSKIDDAGMKSVAELEQLEWLQLFGLPITNAGVRRLSEHKRLAELEVTNCGVTADCLVDIAKMSSLKTLRVGNISGYVTTEATTMRLNEPISQEVRESIKSLDGRLESLRLEGRVHATLLQALSRLGSLKNLTVHDDTASSDDLVNLLESIDRPLNQLSVSASMLDERSVQVLKQHWPTEYFAVGGTICSRTQLRPYIDSAKARVRPEQDE